MAAKKDHSGLRQGESVQLGRPSGELLKAMVMRIEEDAIDVVVRGQIEEGDQLSISRTVQDDARYTSVVEVTAAGRGRSTVRLVGEWQRVQMREYVRVAVFGIPLEVDRTDGAEDTRSERELRLERLRAAEETDDRPARLLDLSGGGLRFESRERYTAGDLLDFGFALPETGPLILRGRVMRVIAAAEATDDTPDAQGFSEYGVAFAELDESMRVRIMTWVFSEQAARFRESKKKDVAS